LKLTVGDETAEVRLEGGKASIRGRGVSFDVTRTGGRLEAIRIAGEVSRVRVAREGERVFVWCAGRALEFRKAAGRPRGARESAGGLAAPMPGRVRRIVACPGARVAQGDVVLILEAMKMEHAIRAPRAGTVSKVFYSEGELVEAGTPLAEIKEDL
jgi:3-methylcrotonyl-CoA carboxylase alpha subunit